MTEASISVSQDQFSCSICLELLRDPATLSCGHSFCLACIRDYWDRCPGTGPWSCPQCRQTFAPRPALGRNGMLAEVIEKLKRTGHESGRAVAAVTTQGYAGPGDVECDFCTGSKRRAVKSCLTCLGSYCEVHLQPHRDVPCLTKHRLVAATVHLQTRTCAQHERILEAFCRTDERLICLLCVMDGHAGHTTVQAAAERTEKQRALLEMKGEAQRRRLVREKEQRDLSQDLNTLKASAQTALRDAERVFSELMDFLQKKRSEVAALIRARQEAETERATALLQQVEQEVEELRRREAAMEQLLRIDDHVEFLQRYESQSTSEDCPRIVFVPQFSFSDVIASVSAMKENTEQIFRDELDRTPHRGDSRTRAVPLIFRTTVCPLSQPACGLETKCGSNRPSSNPSTAGASHESHTGV
ncbi:E3 ubiquitin-protein ligase TRIM47-like isoform X2 [Sardina pilchardus]|uniref:E3 ubiquitin-protein ligase TRIM47-like isoform X2 n=1 Tax=Sardina pilchardus TaxID=27697 RepID=UPI002E1284C2